MTGLDQAARKDTATQIITLYRHDQQKRHRSKHKPSNLEVNVLQHQAFLLSVKNSNLRLLWALTHWIRMIYTILYRDLSVKISRDSQFLKYLKQPVYHPIKSQRSLFSHSDVWYINRTLMKFLPCICLICCCHTIGWSDVCIKEQVYSCSY